MTPRRAALLCAFALAAVLASTAAAADDVALLTEHMVLAPALVREVGAAVPSLPGSDECWSSIVTGVSPCDALDDASRMRFALHLVNCFLRQQGKPEYDCPADVAYTECTSRLSDGDSLTLSVFYAHIENYCVKADAKRFHVSTLGVVNSLLSTSSGVAERLSLLDGTFDKLTEKIDKGGEFLHQLYHANDLVRQRIVSLGKEAREHFEQAHADVERLSTTTAQLSDRSVAIVASLAQVERAQSEALEAQRAWAAQAGEFFEGMSERASSFSSQLGDLQQSQASLLTRQGEALSNIEQLHGSQTSLARLVTQGLEGQRDLIERQGEMVKLQKRSHEAAMKRFETLEAHASELVVNVDESLKLERSLIEAQGTARVQLQALLTAQNAAFDSALGRIDELRAGSTEIFNSLKMLFESMTTLRAAVLGQYFDVQALAYYAGLLFIGFVLTSSRWTNDARLALLALTMANFVFERLYVGRAGGDMHETQAILLAVRQSVVGVSVAVLLATAFMRCRAQRKSRQMSSAVFEMVSRQSDKIDHCESLLLEHRTAILALQERFEAFSGVAEKIGKTKKRGGSHGRRHSPSDDE